MKLKLKTIIASEKEVMENTSEARIHLQLRARIPKNKIKLRKKKTKKKRVVPVLCAL